MLVAKGPLTQVSYGGTCRDMNVRNNNKSTNIYAHYWDTSIGWWRWGSQSPTWGTEDVWKVLIYNIANGAQIRAASGKTSTSQTVMT